MPHHGEHIARGRPVCTVFAEGIDSATCETALKQRAAAIYTILNDWSAVPT